MGRSAAGSTRGSHETRHYSDRVDASVEGNAERAKLADVAALAGVSVSTVSKVLNGRAGIAPDTRARIEALLQDHRYNRRLPAKPSARLLEVLCYELDSPFAGEAIASIERVCTDRGLAMVLTGATDEHLPPAGWSDRVVQRQPAGVILVASRLPAADRERLTARKIPVVLVDPAGEPEPGIPTIGSADWNGGFAATRHLLDLGHRRIAIITGPDDMLASTARLSGYRAALESAGVELDPSYVRPGQFHHRDGLLEGRALLTGPRPPTAIFASSDLQALGVYEAVRTLGLTVPGDLSVVGYDDLRIAQWAGPPLTTVRVPLGQMAEQAAHLALRLGDEPGLAFTRIDVATSMVVRESTAPPADPGN
jgi:LacI family xylobiose transport system transcriptional regulator